MEEVMTDEQIEELIRLSLRNRGGVHKYTNEQAEDIIKKAIEFNKKSKKDLFIEFVTGLMEECETETRQSNAA
jgi:predicted ATP-dependent endonuclease of OLD family